MINMEKIFLRTPVEDEEWNGRPQPSGRKFRRKVNRVNCPFRKTGAAGCQQWHRHLACEFPLRLKNLEHTGWQPVPLKFQYPCFISHHVATIATTLATDIHSALDIKHAAVIAKPPSQGMSDFCFQP